MDSRLKAFVIEEMPCIDGIERFDERAVAGEGGCRSIFWQEGGEFVKRVDGLSRIIIRHGVV